MPPSFLKLGHNCFEFPGEDFGVSLEGEAGGNVELLMFPTFSHDWVELAALMEATRLTG